MASSAALPCGCGFDKRCLSSLRDVRKTCPRGLPLQAILIMRCPLRWQHAAKGCGENIAPERSAGKPDRSVVWGQPPPAVHRAHLDIFRGYLVNRFGSARFQRLRKKSISVVWGRARLQPCRQESIRTLALASEEIGITRWSSDT